MLSAAQKSFVKHKVAQDIARQEGREAMSDGAWAAACGFHKNTAINYNKNPEVKKAIADELKQARESKDFFKFAMRRVALEELWVNYDKAKKDSAEKRHYLKLILEETKDIEEAKESVDYSALCDEDLEAIIFKCEVSPLAKTSEELMALRAELKGEPCSPQESLSPEPSFSEDSDSGSTEPPSETVGKPATRSVKPKAKRGSKSRKRK